MPIVYNVQWPDSKTNMHYPRTHACSYRQKIHFLMMPLNGSIFSKKSPQKYAVLNEIVAKQSGSNLQKGSN